MIYYSAFGIGLVSSLWAANFGTYSHDVFLAHDAEACRALFDRLHGILHLEQPTLRRPDRHVRVVLRA